MPDDNNHNNIEGRHGRPLSSVTTIVNFGILIIMMIGGGVGVMSYLGGLDRNVGILQTQVTNMQSQILGFQAWMAKVTEKIDSAAKDATAAAHDAAEAARSAAREKAR